MEREVGCHWEWESYFCVNGDENAHFICWRQEASCCICLYTRETQLKLSCYKGNRKIRCEMFRPNLPQCWPIKWGYECWIVSFVKVQNLDGHSVPRSMSGISGRFRSRCFIFSNHHLSGGTPTARISPRRRFLSPPAVLRSTFSYDDQIQTLNNNAPHIQSENKNNNIFHVRGRPN